MDLSGNVLSDVSFDMTQFSPDTTFMAKVKTDGFQCIEMTTDRPWTYQVMFCLIFPLT